MSQQRPCQQSPDIALRLNSVFTYHSLLSKSTDLLDSPGGPLLEAYAMDLYPQSISLMFAFSLPPDACMREHSRSVQCHQPD